MFQSPTRLVVSQQATEQSQTLTQSRTSLSYQHSPRQLSQLRSQQSSSKISQPGSEPPNKSELKQSSSSKYIIKFKGQDSKVKNIMTSKFGIQTPASNASQNRSMFGAQTISSFNKINKSLPTNDKNKKQNDDSNDSDRQAIKQSSPMRKPLTALKDKKDYQILKLQQSSQQSNHQNSILNIQLREAKSEIKCLKQHIIDLKKQIKIHVPYQNDPLDYALGQYLNNSKYQNEQFNRQQEGIYTYKGQILKLIIINAQIMVQLGNKCIQIDQYMDNQGKQINYGSQQNYKSNELVNRYKENQGPKFDYLSENERMQVKNWQIITDKSPYTQKRLVNHDLTPFSQKYTGTKSPQHQKDCNRRKHLIQKKYNPEPISINIKESLNNSQNIKNLINTGMGVSEKATSQRFKVNNGRNLMRNNSAEAAPWDRPQKPQGIKIVDKSTHMSYVINNYEKNNLANEHQIKSQKQSTAQVTSNQNMQYNIFMAPNECFERSRSQEPQTILTSMKNKNSINIFE